MAAEKNKLPDWVIDTIFLPLPLMKRSVSNLALYKDKNDRIVISYYDRLSKSEDHARLIDLTTHQDIELSALNLFPKINSHNNKIDGLKEINDDSFGLILPNKSYKIHTHGLFYSGAYFGRCGSPLDCYMTCYKQEKKITSYLLILSSSSNKFEFHTNDFCFGMNGKEKIELHNVGTITSFWIIDDNRIVMAEYDSPFIIVIDANKIDLALRETKTMIFDHAGVKGYWVKKSIIDDCIDKAKEELTGKGYDIYSEKPLKGDMSVNEYIDQMITKELSK
jgi:hypothetical protein